MPEIEITIQKFWAAGTGKKYGSIKTAEGQKYLVKAAMSRAFSDNEVCKVSYHAENWKDGEVNIIDNKISGTVVPHPQVRASTSPKDSKQIFVTALLKEAIGSAQLEPTGAAVVACGQALKQAYEQLFGSAEKQTTETTMNDSMPDEF